MPIILQRPATQARGGVQARGGATIDGSTTPPAVTQASGGGATDDAPPAHRTRSKTSTQSTAGDEFIPSSFVASHKWGQPPAQVANLGHSVPSKFHPTQKLTKEYFTARAIFQDMWKDCEQDANLQAFLTRDYWHPNLVELSDARVL